MGKKRKVTDQVFEEPVSKPEPQPVKTEDDVEEEEEEIKDGNTDGGDDDDDDREEEEEDEAEVSEQDIKNLMEPFSKEQLVSILRDIANKDTDILASIRKLADKDPAHRKIFVHGLGWETTSGTLKSVFSEYGELEDCRVIMDKATGKSKGYGFATFKQMDAARRALKEPSKKIDSRMTVCQMASTGPVPQQPVNDFIGRKIYVSNVPADFPAQKLLMFFSKYGEVEEGPLGFDKQSGKSRGFALFIYKTAEGAKKALEDPNKNVDGHFMHCKRATENQKQNNNSQTLSSVTGPLDPNDLALTHGVLPFNQGAAPGFSSAFNAILASQNQNFSGINTNMNMNTPYLVSMNPSLASSLNPGSQGISPSVQGSLGSSGLYGMHPSLGGYVSQQGGVNPGMLGVYGSQVEAMQGLNAYQNQQLSQSGLPRTSQGGGGSLGGFQSYLHR